MLAETGPDPMNPESPLCTGDPLAKALSVLEPMPTPLNRDQLMFAAGAAGRDRDVSFWKRLVYGQATAACLVVGVGVAMYGFPDGRFRGGRSADTDFAEKQYHAPAPNPVKQPEPKAAPAVPPPEESDDAARLAKYLQLRANVLSLGVNALPNPNAPGANVDVGKLEDSLQLPRGTFAIHGLPAKPKPKPDPDDDQ